jgi:hypothetical protein
MKEHRRTFYRTDPKHSEVWEDLCKNRLNMQNWDMLDFQELRTEVAALTMISLESEML